MRKSVLACFAFILAAVFGLAGPAMSKDLTLPAKTEASVFFSPRGGCTVAAVAEIDKAEHQVLVQAYSFTSKPIADALKRAHARGVDVQVIADKSQLDARGTVVWDLEAAGIDVVFDAVHQIAHNKVMLIDGAKLITGSFNFTAAAESSNAENMLVIRDAGLVAEYAANWRAHREHSNRQDNPGLAPARP